MYTDSSGKGIFVFASLLDTLACPGTTKNLIHETGHVKIRSSTSLTRGSVIEEFACELKALILTGASEFSDINENLMKTLCLEAFSLATHYNLPLLPPNSSPEELLRELELDSIITVGEFKWMLLDTSEMGKSIRDLHKNDPTLKEILAGKDPYIMKKYGKDEYKKRLETIGVNVVI